MWVLAPYSPPPTPCRLGLGRQQSKSVRAVWARELHLWNKTPRGREREREIELQLPSPLDPGAGCSAPPRRAESASDDSALA